MNTKINLIIKPTADCNLRCKYCYHAATNYVEGTLEIAKLEHFLRICCKEYNIIKIIWHGGEPLLAGIAYYKRISKLEKELTKEFHVEFENSIQTNGTLINRKWVTFFKRYHFSPGLSFDGPCNDQIRQNSKQVLKAIKMLKKRKIPVGLISVVTQFNIDQIALYKYNKHLSSNLKFNPIIKTSTKSKEFDISIQDYIRSTIELFDYWLYDREGVYLDPFVCYIYRILGIPYSDCSHGSCLGKFLDIDSSGTIRTCSHSMDTLFVLGNIDKIDSISQLFTQPSFHDLVEKAIDRRKKCIKSCELFKYCQGGCISKAFIEGKLVSRNDFSCLAFRSIFPHVREQITTLLKSQVHLDQLNPVVQTILSEAISLNANEVYGLLRT